MVDHAHQGRLVHRLTDQRGRVPAGLGLFWVSLGAAALGAIRFDGMLILLGAIGLVVLALALYEGGSRTGAASSAQPEVEGAPAETGGDE